MKKIGIVFFGLIFLLGCGDDGFTFEEQLAVDVAKIDRYLEENDLSAQIHSSSIRYIVETEGTGESPAFGDNVTVRYQGTFLNGEVFDENTDGVTFPLLNLIPAWQIMIPTMKAGGTMTIYAPSGYCYGTRGNVGIAPNTNLIFEIELISFE